MIFAGILAGGAGERIGRETPKQFLSLCGRPLLYWPLRRFYEHEAIDQVVVSVRSSHLQFVRAMIEARFEDPGRIRVIAGGRTRFHSLQNLVLHIRDAYGVGDHALLLHEAARPLIGRRVIDDHVRALGRHEATNTLFRVVDTMMISGDGAFIDSVPDKSKSYLGQTPQGYRLGALLEVLQNELTDEDIVNEVDLCAVFLRARRRVRIVRGSELLFKVTYEKDLMLAEHLLRERGAEGW